MITKITVRRLLLCSAALMVFQSGPVLAQDSEVLVIRRVVTKAKVVENEGSEVTPSPSETPNPEPSPVPTEPAANNPNATWRASNLVLRSGGIAGADANWGSVSVEKEVCWDSSISRPVNASECANKPRDPLVGIKTVPAAVYPEIKGIYLDVGDLSSVMPALSNLKNFCSSKYTLNGTAYGVRCMSNPGSLDVVRVPTESTYAADNDPTTGVTNITFTRYECRDTRTGEKTNVPKCSGLPDAEDLQLETIYSTALRTFVIDANEIEARAPTVTGSSSLCMINAVVKINGANQSWKARCDPAEVVEKYEKYATIASPVVQSYPFANNQYQISTSSAGVRCHDTSTGTDAVDQSKCAYLTNPSSVGLLSFASASNPDNRTVVITRDAILAQSPRISNLEAFCKSQVTVSTDETNTKWRLRCDAAALNDAFESYVNSVGYPSQVMPTESMTYSVSTTRCRNLTTGTDAAESSCDTLPEKFSKAQRFPVPILGTSSELRTIAIDPDYLRNIFNNPLLDVCTANVPIYRSGNSGATESWLIRCGADELKEVYERRHSSFYGNTSPYPVAGVSTTIAFRRYQETCWNTELDAPEPNASKCQYLTNSPTEFSGTEIPATYDIQMRRVLISEDDFKNAYKWVTRDPCGTTVDVKINSSASSTDWKVTCNPDEINPDNYERRHASILSPNSAAVGDATISFRRTDSYCWNKKLSKIDQDALCAYLTNSPSDGSSTPIPAIFNPELRRVWVDKNAFDEAYPWHTSSVRNPCSYEISVKPSKTSTITHSWKTTCDKRDIDSSRYYSYATNLSAPSSSSQYPDINSNTLSIRITEIDCFDKIGTQKVDSETCTYLPSENGPQRSDYFKVPSSINNSLRTITVNVADILDQHPMASTKVLCRSTIRTYTTASRTSTANYDLICK